MNRKLLLLVLGTAGVVVVLVVLAYGAATRALVTTFRARVDARNDASTPLEHDAPPRAFERAPLSVAIGEHAFDVTLLVPPGSPEVTATTPADVFAARASDVVRIEPLGALPRVNVGGGALTFAASFPVPRTMPEGFTLVIERAGSSTYREAFAPPAPFTIVKSPEAIVAGRDVEVTIEPPLLDDESLRASFGGPCFVSKFRMSVVGSVVEGRRRVVFSTPEARPERDCTGEVSVTLTRTRGGPADGLRLSGPTADLFRIGVHRDASFTTRLEAGRTGGK